MDHVYKQPSFFNMDTNRNMIDGSDE